MMAVLLPFSILASIRVVRILVGLFMKIDRLRFRASIGIHLLSISVAESVFRWLLTWFIEMTKVVCSSLLFFINMVKTIQLSADFGPLVLKWDATRLSK